MPKRKTTTGPTYEPVHMTDLTEVHEISVQVGPLPINADDVRRIWSECGDMAQDWATATGMEIEIEYFDNSECEDVDQTNAAGVVCCTDHVQVERCVGVRWRVIVGRGTSAIPGTSYNELMTRQHWTWNHRWQHWRNWFQAMVRSTDQRTAPCGGQIVPRPPSSDVLVSLSRPVTASPIQESKGGAGGEGDWDLEQANQSGHPVVSVGRADPADRTPGGYERTSSTWGEDHGQASPSSGV